jgi:phosphatidylglycerophosphate synthase/phosphatidylglycerophosphatase A
MEHLRGLRRHIPNILTVSRLGWAALLFALLARWSFDRSPISRGEGPDALLVAAAGVFIIAALTDLLDGRLARRWGVESIFGRVMDPFADKLLVIGAFVFLAGPGFSTLRLHPAGAADSVPLAAAQVSGVMSWMVVVILGRELLVTSLRGLIEGRGQSFAATASGKWKMVLQSVCIPGVLLLLNVPLSDGAWGDWPLRAIRVLVWTTVAVTAWSGLPYVARALAVLREGPAGLAHGLRPMDELWITSLGLGLMRPAPGTWGSLPPVIIGLALIDAGRGPASEMRWVFDGAMAALAVGFTLVCVRFGAAAEARFGRKDPSQVVADETAGQALTLLFLPAASCATLPRAAATLGLAFAAFRLADILKPPPAHRLQRVPGGWGVVLDDLVAALYALAATQVFARMVF